MTDLEALQIIDQLLVAISFDQPRLKEAMADAVAYLMEAAREHPGPPRYVPQIFVLMGSEGLIT